MTVESDGSTPDRSEAGDSETFPGVAQAQFAQRQLAGPETGVEVVAVRQQHSLVPECAEQQGRRHLSLAGAEMHSVFGVTR